MAAHQTAKITPIHIRQANIQNQGIKAIILCCFQTFATGVLNRGLKFLMQMELFCKGVYQFCVIIDKKNAFTGHSSPYIL
jgi:hypothetical protein